MKRWAYTHGLVLLAALLFAGCATEDIRTLQGQGAKRTFRYGFDDVYPAVMRSVERRKLEIVEQDGPSGRVVLRSGTSLTSLGERIAIFVTRTTPRTSTVEVIARPVVSTITFPPDWPALIFGDIEQELTVVRPPR